MGKYKKFDVLVVYTSAIATSAGSTNPKVLTPFSLSSGRENYKNAYSYFLKICQKEGISAVFTTTGDVIGPGLCKNYWTYSSSGWKKVLSQGFAPNIFDKFSSLPDFHEKEANILYESGLSKPFNDQDLMMLFNDKFETFKKLEIYTLPTVKINPGNIKSSLLKLKQLTDSHPNTKDFTDKFILKDRFGGGGEEIYKIEGDSYSKILKILSSKPDVSFILQPFLEFSKGYTHEGIKSCADIRIITSHGHIIQRYLRIAQENNYKCNEHQGGKVVYIESVQVPAQVSLAYNRIIKILNKDNALFALDFIISDNGNPYFIEGNINPGIYWGESLDDEKNTKKLIRVIIDELKKRTDHSILLEHSYHAPFSKTVPNMHLL